MFKEIKLAILIFILGTLILSTGCGSKSNEKPASSGPELTYKFENMGKIDIKKDIIYKTDKNSKLKLDVYYALGNKEVSKTPTVILVHGVAPDNNIKDSQVYRSWGRKIAASGFTAVTFNWRPSIASKDVSDLIKYVRENSKTLNINSENITVFAFSAGVDEGVKEAMQANTGFIKNIIVYYGEVNESVLTLKPDVKLPSFFIAMGALDSDYPPIINESFISKAKAAGCNVKTMVHSKAGHAFDVFKNDDETKIIIDETLKFIENGSK